MIGMSVARYILSDPSVLPELQRLGYVDSDYTIRVTTSNAAKVVRKLKDIGLRYGIDKRYIDAVKELDSMRGDVFRLHSAFYDTPELAGFADDSEALRLAEDLMGRLMKIYSSIFRSR